MKSPNIRFAKKGDLDKFYNGNKPKRTMRAMVAELDGEIIGIAGIVYHDDVIEVFSDLKDEMHKYPLTIMRAAKGFLKFVSGYNVPVYAIANNCYPNAEEFLARLGFELFQETEQGRMYKWNTSQNF